MQLPFLHLKGRNSLHLGPKITAKKKEVTDASKGTDRMSFLTVELQADGNCFLTVGGGAQFAVMKLVTLVAGASAIGVTMVGTLAVGVLARIGTRLAI